MINHINVTILARGGQHERFDVHTYLPILSYRNTVFDNLKDFGFSIFCNFRLGTKFCRSYLFRRGSQAPLDALPYLLSVSLQTPEIDQF